MKDLNMTEKRRICRLCFTELNEEFTNISSLQTNMLQILIPKLNLHSSLSPMMCRECIKILEEAFAFKSVFVEIEDNLHTYTNDGQNKIELERIVGISEVENHEIKDKKVCRTCLELLENGSFTELTKDNSSLTEVLQKCLPEIDIELTKNPVLCLNCITVLEKTANFITLCITNEEKIINYLKTCNCEKIDLHNVVQYVQLSEEGKTVPTDIIEMEVEIKDKNGVVSLINTAGKTEGNKEIAVTASVVNEKHAKSSKKGRICIISNHVLTNSHQLALPTHINQSNNKELGSTIYIPKEVHNAIENSNSDRAPKNSKVDLSKERVLTRDDIIALTIQSLYNTDSSKDPGEWILDKENTRASVQEIKRARMANSSKEVQNTVLISNSASTRKKYNTRQKNSIVDLTKEDELLSDDRLKNNSNEDSEWDGEGISTGESDEWDEGKNQPWSRKSKRTKMKILNKRPAARRKFNMYCQYCCFKTQEETVMNRHKFDCRINPYFYKPYVPVAQGLRVITTTKPNSVTVSGPPVVQLGKIVSSDRRMFQVTKTKESAPPVGKEGKLVNSDKRESAITKAKESAPLVVEKGKIVNSDKIESAVTKTKEPTPAIYKNVEIVTLNSVIRDKLPTTNKSELYALLVEKDISTKRKRPLLEESMAVLKKPTLQDEFSIFKCTQCGYNTKITERIEQHMRTHIHDETSVKSSYYKIFYCVKCLRPFYNKFSLQCHHGDCANKDQTDAVEVRIGKILYCTLCLFESDNKVLALKHIEDCKKNCATNVDAVEIL